MYTLHVSVKLDTVCTCVFTHFLIRYIFLCISLDSLFHTYLVCGDRMTYYRNLEDFNPLSDSIHGVDLMGIAVASSAQLKHVDMGDNAYCSISLLHNGGAVSRGCRSLTRGVGAVGCPSGAVGAGGAHVVNGGDTVGTGGSCYGMHSWGERGMAFWGKFLGCGGWLGMWWAISSMRLLLFDSLLSRAVAGAHFKMAGVR